MEEVKLPGDRILGTFDEIPQNGAKGFPGPDGTFTGIVVIRQGDQIYAYQNACPHIGTPLDWFPDRFLSEDGQRLVCATHGAEFTIDTGACISGPCQGDHLEPVDVVVRDGVILIAEGK